MSSTTSVAKKTVTDVSTTKGSSSKIAPIVSTDEAQWLTDMGLGRGVDAAKADLWKEKSSFQVQSIWKSLDNIIGTDEGGARNYYEREVSSISSRQTQLKLSVVEPHSAVQIGVESTFSQSVSKSRKSVGEEIATRTISFRTHFDDLPFERIDKETIKRSSKSEAAKTHQVALVGKKYPSEVTTEIKSFEEQLSDWLLDRLRARADLGSTGHDGSASDDTESSTVKLANFLYNCPEETRKKVVSDCLLFIKQTGVTHYVHSIQLGAKKFRVLSKSEFARKVGVKGKLGVEKLAKASASVSHTSTWSKKNSSLNVKEIGKITDGRVKRGVGEEAVISFKVMPVHILITSHHVNSAMKKALRNYMIEKAVESKGPYLVTCGSEKMRLYWKVDDSNKVIATPDVESASMFFLSSTDEEDIPEEFMINYYGEDKDVLMKPKGALDPMSKEEPLAALPRYLDGPVSFFGHNDGPLEVKPNVKEENARYVLHNRVFEGYEPAAVKSWEMGEEFYINCSRRRFRWDGYLAVKKVNAKDFTTVIVPLQDKHDGVDTFLLFRLMPVEYKTIHKNH